VARGARAIESPAAIAALEAALSKLAARNATLEAEVAELRAFKSRVLDAVRA
jgi:cell division protein FtsB